MEGRAKNEQKKGLWTKEEDRILKEYVRQHGKGKWNGIAKSTGLKRSGRSCRLRWINYLNPDLKHGNFSQDEDDLIIRLHNLLGNRWSLIAGRIPGRTDNKVKNYWNTHLSKKLKSNKGKNKVNLCSQMEITEVREFNSKLNSISKDDEIVTTQMLEDDTISSIGISGKQELTMSDCHDNNFLFLNDDFNFCNNDLLDFINDYCLDFD